jgi:two-component system OmpR family sensor kinase
VALLTIGLTITALAVAGFGVYSLVSQFLDDRLDDQLRALRGPAGLVLAGGNRGGRVPPELDAQLTFGQLRGPDGRVLVSSFLGEPTELHQQPSLPEALDASDDDRTFDASGMGDGAPVDYRVLVSQIMVAGTPTGALQVLALPRTDADATLSRLVTIEVVTAVVVSVVAAVLAWWLAGLGLRPLRRIEDTAATIACGGDLSRRVDPRSRAKEIVELGSSLNTMLGRIETAFEDKEASEARLRRFVADASHELRTPLTSIRGYAELFRRGAADDPATLARSMERIEGEATRMAGLVDDLLLLARLDEGRPLDRRSVDLSALAADVVHDAAAAGPDHPITLAADESVEVDGDRERLTQVLVNLVTNARMHTPRGTAIEVGVAHDGPVAVVTVADHGPGIADADKAQVFNRFHRTDPSRARDRGGAGLGLAIIDAVVRAHGGTVTVGDTPGGGATFVVRLPRRTARAEVAHAPSAPVPATP